MIPYEIRAFLYFCTLTLVISTYLPKEENIISGYIFVSTYEIIDVREYCNLRYYNDSLVSRTIGSIHNSSSCNNLKKSKIHCCPKHKRHNMYTIAQYTHKSLALKQKRLLRKQ